MYNRYQGNTGRVLRVSDEPGSPAVGQAALPGHGGSLSPGPGGAAAGAGNTASGHGAAHGGDTAAVPFGGTAPYSAASGYGAARPFYAPAPRRSGPFFEPERAQARESAPHSPGVPLQPRSAAGASPAPGPAPGTTMGSAAGPAPGGGGFIQPGRAAPRQAPRPVPGPPPGSIRPPGPLSGLSGELGRLLGRLSPMKLETDDLLLMMVLYLMYRESHDEELLFIMAAMFLL